MTDPKLIEAMARAAYAKTDVFWQEERPDQPPLETWEDAGEGLHRHWLIFAEAALAAINASGTHWVAPVDVSDAMYDAGYKAEGVTTIYDAMRTAYLAKTEETA